MARENTFSRYRRTLDRFGVPYEEFDQVKAENPSLSNADIVWGLFNKALSLNAGKWKATSSIYYSMAWFLKDTGKDFYRIRKLSTDFELRDIVEWDKTSSHEIKVEILADPEPCVHCKGLNGKKYSIAQAQEGLPFPAEVCENSRGFCRSMICGVPGKDKPISPKSGCLGVALLLIIASIVTIVTLL